GLMGAPTDCTPAAGPSLIGLRCEITAILFWGGIIGELASMGSFRGAWHHRGPSVFLYQVVGAGTFARGGGLRPRDAGDIDLTAGRVAARRLAFLGQAQGGDLRVCIRRVHHSL